MVYIITAMTGWLIEKEATIVNCRITAESIRDVWEAEGFRVVFVEKED